MNGCGRTAGALMVPGTMKGVWKDSGALVQFSSFKSQDALERALANFAQKRRGRSIPEGCYVYAESQESI